MRKRRRTNEKPKKKSALLVTWLSVPLSALSLGCHVDLTLSQSVLRPKHEKKQKTEAIHAFLHYRFSVAERPFLPCPCFLDLLLSILHASQTFSSRSVFS